MLPGVLNDMEKLLYICHHYSKYMHAPDTAIVPWTPPHIVVASCLMHALYKKNELRMIEAPPELTWE